MWAEAMSKGGDLSKVLYPQQGALQGLRSGSRRSARERNSQQPKMLRKQRMFQQRMFRAILPREHAGTSLPCPSRQGRVAASLRAVPRIKRERVEFCNKIRVSSMDTYTGTSRRGRRDQP